MHVKQTRVRKGHKGKQKTSVLWQKSTASIQTSNSSSRYDYEKLLSEIKRQMDA